MKREDRYHNYRSEFFRYESHNKIPIRSLHFTIAVFYHFFLYINMSSYSAIRIIWLRAILVYCCQLRWIKRSKLKLELLNDSILFVEHLLCLTNTWMQSRRKSKSYSTVSICLYFASQLWALLIRLLLCFIHIILFQIAQWQCKIIKFAPTHSRLSGSSCRTTNFYVKKLCKSTAFSTN